MAEPRGEPADSDAASRAEPTEPTEPAEPVERAPRGHAGHPADEPPSEKGWWRSARLLAVHTVKDAIDDRAPGLAAEVAFFSILALPPLVLALFGVAGFVSNAVGAAGTETMRGWVLDVADDFLSDQTMREAVEPTVAAVLEEGRADIALIGLALALWSGSRATNVTMRAITIAYDLDPRPGWKRRSISLLITLLGMLAGLAILPALVLGPRLGELLDIPGFAAAWQVAYWPAMAVVVMGLLATLYHFTAPWKTPWIRDLPGALFGVVLWIGGAAALRIYTAWTISADSTYGPLATPIVVLLWLYLTALAVVMGAELNAEVEKLWPHPDTRYELQTEAAVPSGAPPAG